MCRSFHRGLQSSRITDHFSPSPLLRGFCRISVFLPADAVSPKRCSPPVKKRHRSPGGCSAGEGRRNPRCLGAGRLSSGARRFDSRAGQLQMSAGSAERGRDAVISQPRPSVTVPANHSAAGGGSPPALPLGGPPVRHRRLVGNLNTEIT